jgi:P4 family phage/plasmid primase-like protien
MAGKSPKSGKDKADHSPPAADSSVTEQAKTFSPHLRARNNYINKHKNVLFGRGRFLEYSAGIFSEIPQYKVRREIAEIGEKVTGFEVTSHSVSSVVDLVRDARSEADAKFDSRHDVLLFRDCVLDLNTFERKPHSPIYRATSKLPFDYAPEKTSAAWGRWGRDVLPDVLKFLEEYGGLCLTTETRHELTLWLVGMPGCGKGTYIEALRAALGPQRWTTLSAKDVAGRFGLVSLAGKTLAISAEAPPIHRGRYTDIVNTIISGEPIKVEEKSQPAYDLIPRCKLVWAMNNLPVVNEANNGIFRRACVVKMEQVEEQDMSLKASIAADGQALVNVFVAGLRRLRERGKFDVPPSVRAATSDFQRDSDHVLLFIEDRTVKETDHREKSIEVFTAYRQWCDEHGIRNILNSVTLRPQIERLGFRYKRSNGSWYEGLKLV